jgi:hypothetical protein
MSTLNDDKPSNTTSTIRCDRGIAVHIRVRPGHFEIEAGPGFVEVMRNPTNIGAGKGATTMGAESQAELIEHLRKWLELELTHG